MILILLFISQAFAADDFAGLTSSQTTECRSYRSEAGMAECISRYQQQNKEEQEKLAAAHKQNAATRTQSNEQAKVKAKSQTQCNNPDLIVQKCTKAVSEADKALSNFTQEQTSSSAAERLKQATAHCVGMCSEQAARSFLATCDSADDSIIEKLRDLKPRCSTGGGPGDTADAAEAPADSTDTSTVADTVPSAPAAYPTYVHQDLSKLSDPNGGFNLPTTKDESGYSPAIVKQPTVAESEKRLSESQKEVKSLQTQLTAVPPSQRDAINQKLIVANEKAQQAQLDLQSAKAQDNLNLVKREVATSSPTERDELKLKMEQSKLDVAKVELKKVEAERLKMAGRSPDERGEISQKLATAKIKVEQAKLNVSSIQANQKLSSATSELQKVEQERIKLLSSPTDKDTKDELSTKILVAKSKVEQSKLDVASAQANQKSFSASSELRKVESEKATILAGKTSKEDRDQISQKVIVAKGKVEEAKIYVNSAQADQSLARQKEALSRARIDQAMLSKNATPKEVQRAQWRIDDLQGKVSISEGNQKIAAAELELAKAKSSRAAILSGATDKSTRDEAAQKVIQATKQKEQVVLQVLKDRKMSDKKFAQVANNELDALNRKAKSRMSDIVVAVGDGSDASSKLAAACEKSYFSTECAKAGAQAAYAKTKAAYIATLAQKEITDESLKVVSDPKFDPKKMEVDPTNYGLLTSGKTPSKAEITYGRTTKTTCIPSGTSSKVCRIDYSVSGKASEIIHKGYDGTMFKTREEAVASLAKQQISGKSAKDLTTAENGVLVTMGKDVPKSDQAKVLAAINGYGTTTVSADSKSSVSCTDSLTGGVKYCTNASVSGYRAGFSDSQGQMFPTYQQAVASNQQIVAATPARVGIPEARPVADNQRQPIQRLEPKVVDPKTADPGPQQVANNQNNSGTPATQQTPTDQTAQNQQPTAEEQQASTASGGMPAGGTTAGGATNGSAVDFNATSSSSQSSNSNETTSGTNSGNNATIGERLKSAVASSVGAISNFFSGAPSKDNKGNADSSPESVASSPNDGGASISATASTAGKKINDAAVSTVDPRIAAMNAVDQGFYKPGGSVAGTTAAAKKAQLAAMKLKKKKKYNGGRNNQVCEPGDSQCILSALQGVRLSSAQRRGLASAGRSRDITTGMEDVMSKQLEFFNRIELDEQGFLKVQ